MEYKSISMWGKDNENNPIAIIWAVLQNTWAVFIYTYILESS